MAQPSGTLGTKLFITDTAIASTVDTEGEFMAQAWTEVGLITNFGEFGRVFTNVPFQSVGEGRTYKLKGGYDDGQIQLTLGQALSDDGQAILADAAEDPTQDNYGFRIELNDPPTAIGGPTTYLFRGLAMSYRSTLGGLNDVVRAMSTVEINSTILHIPPADFYDRFTSGSLTQYELFSGSDTEAVDPVISGNNLVLVTGNAAASPPATFAEDGSQAIADTGYTLSGGPVVFEARVKLSAITTVSVFFGLTDQKAALEIPIESASSTDDIVTNATDAVGFMFDTEMATDNIWLVGVNNNVDETAQDSGLAFVADTYRTLRIEVAANGDAVFKVNGAVVGSTMTTACRTSVPLYPTLAASARSTSSRTITADYVYVRQD